MLIISSLETKLLQEELAKISKSNKYNDKKDKKLKTIGGRKIEIATIEELESKQENI